MPRFPPLAAQAIAAFVHIVPCSWLRRPGGPSLFSVPDEGVSAIMAAAIAAPATRPTSNLEFTGEAGPVPVPGCDWRRFRNDGHRREHGVERGIARCGSTGLVLRQLLLQQCQIAALARLGLRVPTLRLGLIGGNAMPIGIQIPDGHHGDTVAAVSGLPIKCPVVRVEVLQAWRCGRGRFATV